MWLMLQQDETDDYVPDSGETMAVNDFFSETFRQIGIARRREGEGVNEKGIYTETGLIIVDLYSRLNSPVLTSASRSVA